MDFFLIVQAVIAVVLMISILLQHRASGLSATFGGGTNTSYVQRRGAEKVLYQGSVILSILFFALTVVQWYV